MPLKVRWPHWEVGRSPLYWNVASKLTIAAVGIISKIFMGYLNSKRVYNIESLYTAINNRAPDQGLVTFSNHHSCLDEPLIWTILSWRHYIKNMDCMRWTTGAADVCFKKEWHSTFFALGRTVPLVRGDGVHQYSVDFALQLLNAGEWVHIYPEGKVTRDEVRLKWGVGRMVAEASKAPILLGLYHLGMDDILPNNRPYRLHTGKQVTVVVGEPVDVSGVLGIGDEKMAGSDGGGGRCVVDGSGRRVGDDDKIGCLKSVRRMAVDGRMLVNGGSRVIEGSGERMMEGGERVMERIADERVEKEDVRVVKRRLVTQCVQKELKKLKAIASQHHSLVSRDKKSVSRNDDTMSRDDDTISRDHNYISCDNTHQVEKTISKKEEMGGIRKKKLAKKDVNIEIDESPKREPMRRVEGKKR